MFLDATAQEKHGSFVKITKIFSLQDHHSSPKIHSYTYPTISTSASKSAQSPPFQAVSESFSHFIIFKFCDLSIFLVNW